MAGGQVDARIAKQADELPIGADANLLGNLHDRRAAFFQDNVLHVHAITQKLSRLGDEEAIAVRRNGDDRGKGLERNRRPENAAIEIDQTKAGAARAIDQGNSDFRLGADGEPRQRRDVDAVLEVRDLLCFL
jgi:hypothetical protein